MLSFANLLMAILCPCFFADALPKLLAWKAHTHYMNEHSAADVYFHEFLRTSAVQPIHLQNLILSDGMVFDGAKSPHLKQVRLLHLFKGLLQLFGMRSKKGPCVLFVQIIQFLWHNKVSYLATHPFDAFRSTIEPRARSSCLEICKDTSDNTRVLDSHDMEEQLQSLKIQKLHGHRQTKLTCKLVEGHMWHLTFCVTRLDHLTTRNTPACQAPNSICVKLNHVPACQVRTESPMLLTSIRFLSMVLVNSRFVRIFPSGFSLAMVAAVRMRISCIRPASLVTKPPKCLY